MSKKYTVFYSHHDTKVRFGGDAWIFDDPMYCPRCERAEVFLRIQMSGHNYYGCHCGAVYVPSSPHPFVTLSLAWLAVWDTWSDEGFLQLLDFYTDWNA